MLTMGNRSAGGSGNGLTTTISPPFSRSSNVPWWAPPKRCLKISQSSSSESLSLCFNGFGVCVASPSVVTIAFHGGSPGMWYTDCWGGAEGEVESPAMPIRGVKAFGDVRSGLFMTGNSSLGCFLRAACKLGGGESSLRCCKRCSSMRLCRSGSSQRVKSKRSSGM